jgi:hypothetical protein
MPIIKTESKNGVKIYTVEKEFDDSTMNTKMNHFLKREHIHTILDHDADVYTAEGKLLLIFRKNSLPKNHIEAFYDNIIKFAQNVSSNRGSASGSKKKNITDNPGVMSNIFGYFDRWSPSQKANFKKMGKKPKVDVRECRFNMDYPDLYQKTIPLIKDIDTLYAKYTPEYYKKQRKKANQTFFKIPNTAFTTITTNVNYQTSVHTDKGDDEEGFGNLAVIEKGEYKGAETCFPQYGIGVDVRTGDMLFMDVHQPHGNLKFEPKDKEAKRLSIVCYLRKNVWLKTMNKSKSFFDSHIKYTRTFRKTNIANKTRKNKKKE